MWITKQNIYWYSNLHMLFDGCMFYQYVNPKQKRVVHNHYHVGMATLGENSPELFDCRFLATHCCNSQSSKSGMVLVWLLQQACSGHCQLGVVVVDVWLGFSSDSGSPAIFFFHLFLIFFNSYCCCCCWWWWCRRVILVIVVVVVLLLLVVVVGWLVAWLVFVVVGVVCWLVGWLVGWLVCWCLIVVVGGGGAELF